MTGSTAPWGEQARYVFVDGEGDTWWVTPGLPPAGDDHVWHRVLTFTGSDDSGRWPGSVNELRACGGDLTARTDCLQLLAEFTATRAAYGQPPGPICKKCKIAPPF